MEMQAYQSTRAYGKMQKGIDAVLLWARLANERIAVLGTSGGVHEMLRAIAACADRQNAVYHPNRRLITWPNGTTVKGYVAGQEHLMGGTAPRKAWVHGLCPRCDRHAFESVRMHLRGDNVELFVSDCGEEEGLLPALERLGGVASLRRPSFEEFKRLPGIVPSRPLGGYVTGLYPPHHEQVQAL